MGTLLLLELGMGRGDAELGQGRTDTYVHHTCKYMSYTKDAEVKQPLSRLVRSYGVSDTCREIQRGGEAGTD